MAKPARVRPKLVIDGASASAIEAFPLGSTSIRNKRGESLGVAASGCVTWGSSQQTFEAFAVGGRTALRAINGKFVSSLPNGTMRADAEDIGADELFVPWIGGNTVALRAKNGGFLGGDAAAVTMDEGVLTQIAEKQLKPEASRRIVNTFESEVEPGVTARLIPAAASAAAIRMTTLCWTKPLAAEAPARKRTFDIDFGKCESLCGASGIHRLMIPIPNASDRAAAKVHLEQDPEVAKIVGVTQAGTHLVVTIASDFRLSGSYPVKVVVDFNGKTITGEANIVIKHTTPQPFGISAIVGGQSDAAVPYMGELWKRREFAAHFEPAAKEFRLTNARGMMEAGSKYFPFRIVFMPKGPTPVTTLLVVVFDQTEEYTVKIVGTAAGFTGRTWMGRSKQTTSTDFA